MLSEFRLRREIESAEKAPESPIRKAKALLRIAKRVRRGAVQMDELSDWYFKNGDPLRGARFGEAREQLLETHREVRRRAASALTQGPPGVG